MGHWLESGAILNLLKNEKPLFSSGNQTDVRLTHILVTLLTGQSWIRK
jgi:hypothetical protein